MLSVVAISSSIAQLSKDAQTLLKPYPRQVIFSLLQGEVAQVAEQDRSIPKTPETLEQMQALLIVGLGCSELLRRISDIAQAAERLGAAMPVSHLMKEGQALFMHLPSRTVIAFVLHQVAEVVEHLRSSPFVFTLPEKA